MSIFKRSCSPCGGEDYGQDVKTAGPAHGGDTEMAGGNSATQQLHDEVEITVTLPSTSKADRNDPRAGSTFLPFFPIPPVVSGPSCIIHRVPRSDESLPTPAGNNGHERPIVPADDMEDNDLDPEEWGPAGAVDGAGDRFSIELEKYNAWVAEGEPVSRYHTMPWQECMTTGDDDQFFDDDHDEFEEYPWLEQIEGFGKVNRDQIASCDAKLIRRSQIRPSFWLDMEGPTDDTSSLAFDLFDRYGRVKREFCEHEIRKGTGVWGKELDEGDLLLFENIHVESRWRGHHIASKIAGAVLNKARTKSRDFFALVQPGFLCSQLIVDKEEERVAIEEEAARVATNFWRSLGFRQVGTSGWFAFADDANHPSRQLSATEDEAEPTRPQNQGPITKEQAYIIDGLADPEISGAECVQRIRHAFPDAEAARFWLSEADYEGDTMLHAASLGWKPQAVTYILSICPHLRSSRNATGYTALEAFQDRQELHRTRQGHILTVTKIISDEFTGFPQRVIETLGALTGAEVFDLTKLSTREVDSVGVPGDPMNSVPETGTIRASLRMKYGCTCGQCISGFLSPRMLFALQSAAGSQYDHLVDEMTWDIFSYNAARHLPQAVRMSLDSNRSIRKGFINMFLHISHCLEDKRLPTEENVLDLCRRKKSGLPSTTSNYLQSGGTVRAVATAIFEEAMGRDEWAGNGQHSDVFGDDIDKLPSCRNDHEFGFVSGLCGHERVASGPHIA